MPHCEWPVSDRHKPFCAQLVQQRFELQGVLIEWELNRAIEASLNGFPRGIWRTDADPEVPRSLLAGIVDCVSNHRMVDRCGCCLMHLEKIEMAKELKASVSAALQGIEAMIDHRGLVLGIRVFPHLRHDR